MYITFEGIDTTGKSTQIELFKKNYKTIVATKEPGGTKIGIKLREILLNNKERLGVNTELLIFLADRAEHYEKIVKPALKKHNVISDRGLISGISYALANHPKLDLDFLIKINKFTLDNNLPDKVIFFKTNYELLSSRLDKKKRDTIEKRGIEYLLEVQLLMQKILNVLGVEYLEINSADSRQKIYRQIEGFIYD
ncbi:MAG: dTMP kinase [Sulfurospirillum sp.]|nr:dTMP kinase [Sulfurospirillum sp.]MBL0702708.1 dTMP kinase [Sulfurospirillum sp.]